MTDGGPHLVVVGHPGHEMRCFGWLLRQRPVVCALTDGSGLGGRSRLPSTTRILDAAGARVGPVYGQMTDVEVYETTMAQEHGRYLEIVDDLVEWLREHRPQTIVGDAAEGRESTHDICRLLIGAATQIYTRRQSTPPGLYDFPLFGLPDTLVGSSEGVIHLELSDEEFERKIAQALRYEDLAAEVHETFDTLGEEVFRHEYFRPVAADDAFGGPVGHPPYYETYALQQVERGVFERALVYDPHVLSLTRALRNHVLRRSP